MKLPAIGLLACAVLIGLAPAHARQGEARDVRFNRDVRPLLADHCFACHGPDEHERKGKLRLDRPDGPQGSYRTRYGTPAIEPGSLDDSELWYRLTTDDEDDAMPPADSHQDPLSPAEKAVIQRWIEGGAQYEAHWSFVAPTRPAEPEVEDASWCRDPLDRFVLHKLEASGMAPSPRADRRTLIRRVTLDLTGLPPTRAEIAAFLGDPAPDAYERLVEGLLARPQYGEHMARYWLDLVRFADTNGVHHDHYRDTSVYRDWVIRSFNANLPYDEFVIDQLSGDLFPEPTDDQLIASGFNRLHMIIDRGTALPEESLARNVNDRVIAVGTAFLGLTVQCAVCHDHKYDPVTQRDFYQLSAFFNNLDGDPETGSGESDKQRGLQPPYVEFPSPEQEAALADVAGRIAEAQARVDALKAEAAEAESEASKEEVAEDPAGAPRQESAGGPPEVPKDEVAEAEGEALEAARDEELEKRVKELQALQAERNEILAAVPAAMVMKERAEPRPAYVLVRGAYDNPGEPVERATPEFLPPLKAEGTAPTRMDLAEWFVSPEHPLTARVAVNRFWQQFFGVGLVKTSEDFGTKGEWPSHLELLDHLAVSFVESGWDVKSLARRIVLSATYCQSSEASLEAFRNDPENRLLARGSRFRMDAEMIRDQILATSGLLNTTMYGKSVKPPQPEGIWAAVTLPSSYPRTYTPDTGDATRRRSVYTFWKRAMPPPQMSILNAPTRESCTARRERTNTPLQALLLLNEHEYLKAARHLAAGVLADEGSPEGRLSILYETVTSRLPDEFESATLLDAVRDLEARYGRKPALAARLCEGVELAEGESASELAAWTVLASTVYNLDITKTRE